MDIDKPWLARLFCLLAFFPAHGVGYAQAGMIDTTFNRLDTAAYVYHDVNAILYQPDGRIVIGGGAGFGYSKVGMIARYLPNGSYDSSFRTGTGFDLPTTSLALQPDGKIIAGGNFSHFNGIACEPLVRLLSNGNIDTGFHAEPGLLNTVFMVFLQPNGDIIVNDYKEGLVRLHGNGTQDSSFVFTQWPYYYFGSTVAQQSDGKLLLYIGYTQQLLRIDSSGKEDKSFRIGNGFHGQVQFISPLTDGRIIVAGSFDNYDGHVVKDIVRLYPNGKLDSSYAPQNLGIGGPTSMILQPDGKLLVGGYEPGILRLNNDGTVDTGYHTGIVFPPGYGYYFSDNAPRTLCLQADTQLLVGGYNYASDKYVRLQMLRLKQDGALDVNFRIGSSVCGSVAAIAVQKDRKIVVAGSINSYFGIPRFNVLRLYEDGTLDSSFTPRLNSVAYDMALQEDGKIILGGEFTECNGVACTNLIRLNPDGSNDTSFHQGIGFATSDPTMESPFVTRVFLQRDGKVIVNGGFEFYNGAAHTDILRLNRDGTEDTSFRLATIWFTHILQQPDGKLLMESPSWALDGQSGKGIFRLDTNGKLDPGFSYQPDEHWWIDQVFLQPDGKVVVGLANDTDGNLRYIRLFGDGSPDNTFLLQFQWDRNAVRRSEVIGVQPDGKILYTTDTSIERLTKDGYPDPVFYESKANSLGINCTAFQPDGKIIFGGSQLGVGEYATPIYDVPVKNGLYRLQNCMVVVAQREPDSGRVGASYHSNIYWSNPDSSIKLSLLNGTIPAGLSLNAQTGVLNGIPATAGRYNFTMLASNGQCSDSISYNIVIDSARDNDTTSDWVVYPIPTRDRIHIKFGNSPTGNYDIQLHDLSGRALLKETATVDNSHKELAYDMRRYASGIYLLTITGDQRRMVYKIERL